MGKMKFRFIFFFVLALGSVSFSSLVWSVSEKVTFNGADNVKIIGKFNKPSSHEKWTLVLLHGVGSVKEEWNSFFDLLSSNGYGVLIYDQRGHGESMKKITGESIDFQKFYARGLKSEWGKMIQDLGVAIQFLKEKYKIDPKTIAVGGASIGANIALRYASSHNDVPFAVLLSPGGDYQGITTIDAMSDYGTRSLFMASSPLDGYSYQSVMALQSADESLKSGKGPAYTVYVESQNQGHGVQMFKRKKADQPSSLEDHLLRWIGNQKRR